MKIYDLIQMMRLHFGSRNQHISQYFDEINQKRFEKFEKLIRQKFIVQELLCPRAHSFTKKNIIQDNHEHTEEIFSHWILQNETKLIVKQIKTYLQQKFSANQHEEKCKEIDRLIDMYKNPIYNNNPNVEKIQKIFELN